MTRKEIINRIAEASAAADESMKAYLNDPEADEKKLAETIKQYIAIKQQLLPEEVSDNITIMVRISVSKASGIPLDKLKEMDRPGACGSAPTVLAKRILLFLDIQKKLGVSMDPQKAQHIQTVEDLVNVLYPLLLKKDQGD